MEPGRDWLVELVRFVAVAVVVAAALRAAGTGARCRRLLGWPVLEMLEILVVFRMLIVEG